jgi:predicted ATPase/class 3 adenylate cyclase/Tfp pilus assembly protein PilF
MGELPTGTVTFLFTDVAGSTRLLHALGRDRYSEVLGHHHRLLREAFAGHDGVEVDTAGDGFFVAFRLASDGVAAAAAAQRALASHPWRDGEELRVRIGLHTGEARLGGEGYIGLDVHRAARIAAAAHGGQVLVSQATRELLGRDLPGGLSLRDLGEHRLKDLTLPQRLSQLLIPGLSAAFPPLKTLENRSTNLPTQPTPLVGRRRELSEVVELMGREDVRLLTLTGPGGTGKTRLALQAGAELLDRYTDGVYFVSLAHLGDPELVLPTICQTLELQEAGGQPLMEMLTDHLCERRFLLVLDNFEHLLGAGLLLAEVLAAAPDLRLLVTTRAPLRLSMEREYQVPPLSEYDAAALLVERAQAVRSDFRATSQNAAAIADICIRLDGLPLAIELAAARMRVLSPEALLKRLEGGVKLLTGGPRDRPGRQQTLSAAIEWSYRLLQAEEQRLFARLSVFAGGFTLEAAEAVCDPEGELDVDVFDGICSLVENAMLRREQGLEGEPRFSMLETIREYAVERLEDSGEAEALRGRHADHFLELAEESAQELRGPGEHRWLERLEAEHSNFRAALTWSARTGAIELQLTMAGALSLFWGAHGHFTEGRGWLEQALSSPNAQPPGARASALMGAASLAIEQGDFATVEKLAQESLTLCRAQGDLIGIPRSLTLLAFSALQQDSLDRARRLYEESVALARRSGDLWNLARALNNLGNLGFYEGDPARGVEAWQEALRLSRELGNADLTGSVLSNLGFAALAQQDEEGAAKLFCESLELFRRVGMKLGIFYDLEGLAAVAASRQADERAARLLGAAESMREEIGACLESFEAGIHEQTVERAQGRLGQSLFASAHAEGRGFSLEEATAYAIK